jgi:hypothetical protein
MAMPPEKLAESLELLEKLQAAGGAAAIRARDLTRTHRERLMQATLDKAGLLARYNDESLPYLIHYSIQELATVKRQKTNANLLLRAQEGVILMGSPI